MSKTYIVTAIQKYRVEYQVSADSEEEARRKVESDESESGVYQMMEQFDDHDHIVEVIEKPVSGQS